MKTLATDMAWNNITWRGTTTKKSFLSDFKPMHDLIIEIVESTFSDIDNLNEFVDSKIKTFLRHAPERVKRLTDSNAKSESKTNIDDD